MGRHHGRRCFTLSQAGVIIIAIGGGEFPSELLQQLEACEGDDPRTLELGIRWATLQCRELLDAGAPGIHFYTLNRSPATRRIHANLFS